MKDLSFVIPLFNEAESLPELHERLAKVCKSQEWDYEIILVDDGSVDDSWEVIKKISKKDDNLKALRFQRNYGKSAALQAAFPMCQGRLVATLDADLQDLPEEVPSLVQKLIAENLDLVSGWKQNRKDHKLTKNLPSKLFNWVARVTSGIQLHDFNCGLKVYRQEVVQSIHLHGDMHRYIPVLAKNAGYPKIGEQRVKHVARKFGKSKFGNRRFINGFLDLITLTFLSRFGHKPMHFFGAMGVLMFVLGLLATLFIGLEKLYIVFVLNKSARFVTDNPGFYIALFSMLFGLQFFLAGFLGELILRNSTNNKSYRIKSTINLKEVE